MQERYKCKLAVFLVITRTTENGEEILLQRRCNTSYMNGKYDMACSGHVEQGESLVHAVSREAFEELGIEVDEHDLEFLHLYDPSAEEGILNLFYRPKKYTGIPTIKESDKCDDLSWFSIDNLPENIIPCVGKAIECMRKGILYDDFSFSFLEESNQDENTSGSFRV